jgi:hypothetical protein
MSWSMSSTEKEALLTLFATTNLHPDFELAISLFIESSDSIMGVARARALPKIVQASKILNLDDSRN